MTDWNSLIVAAGCTPRKPCMRYQRTRQSTGIKR